MAQLIQVNPYAPEPWLVKQVVAAIDGGAVLILPTDTVYAIVCSIENKRALETIYRIKSAAPGKPLSVLFSDLSTITDYTRGIPNNAFRIMKRTLPGPYTYILEASKRMPPGALEKRTTIGVRIPDHPVALAVLRELSAPLLATSVTHEDDHVIDDPIELSQRLGRDVGYVVDAGAIYPQPSTVIDFTGVDPVVIREGKGSLDRFR
jgi:tRNA threonylcarbamoyl adenosine modification protein (Sua5/YciO/YrdC/YwlC family)